MQPRRIVVIGGMAAGPKAAARARRLDSEAEITVLEKGGTVSFGTCGLPLYLAGMVPSLAELQTTASGQLRDAEFFWRERRIRVVTGTEVLRIEPAAHRVLARRNGEQFTLPYDHLILATGSRPLWPPISGLGSPGVFGLRRPADAEALRNALTPGKRAVVVGGGMIGLEVADALVSRRLRVTIVEARSHLLPGLLDEDMAALLRRHLEQQGITVLTDSPAEGIVAGDGHLRLHLASSAQVAEGDVAVVACGVRPEVSLAAEAGLKRGWAGAVAVDDYLQTSEADIFAAGDCAETTHVVTGRKTWLPLASTANKQGRVAGSNAAGARERFAGVAGTAVLQVAECNVARTGLGEEEARQQGYQVVTGLVSGPDCAHYYPMHAPLAVKVIADARDGRVLGAQAVGPGEAVKRIDVVATSLAFSASLEQLAGLDLGYAPPFATAIDICLHVANQARNRLAELGRPVTAAELKAKMEGPEPPVLVDVRQAEEYAERRLPYPAQAIPLGELRERLGEIPPDREVVAVCELGVRGYEAQCLLRGAGFDRVSYLEGGIWAWPYGVHG